MSKLDVFYHKHEAIIVGGGGAGLYAALSSSMENLDVAVISKLYPVRSHTGAAQGGIGAALSNIDEDSPQWHIFDTVKGSDFLADQDAVAIMCKEAPNIIYDLEHMGLPFNRTSAGLIAQRKFGGHTKNMGKDPVHRSCYSADRTGHMVLQTLYQQCIKRNVCFYNEFSVVDLIFNNNKQCSGVIAYSMQDATLHVFHAKSVLLATGGSGRMFDVTSNACSLTGDGMGIALRNEIPLEDMEFFQFHPTGIYKMGILLSEACRGEGGVLRNGLGERFMEKYAPRIKDLAPRDIVSRCIYQEVTEGRGIDGKDFIHLDLTHLGASILEERLPDICDFVRVYMGLDPVTDLIPVQPTAHYSMGGIPTTINGEVCIDAKDTIIQGLYAAGECACVSVHGANRLGTNSLLDILVFGKRAGKTMVQYCREIDYPVLPIQPEMKIKQVMKQLFTTKKNPPKRIDIEKKLRKLMMKNCGVMRNQSQLQFAIKELCDLCTIYQDVFVSDQSDLFNFEVMDVLELGYLLDLAKVTLCSASERKESRGSHFREDFPKRDDKNWLKHTLSIMDSKTKEVKLQYKSVVLGLVALQERKY